MNARIALKILTFPANPWRTTTIATTPYTADQWAKAHRVWNRMLRRAGCDAEWGVFRPTSRRREMLRRAAMLAAGVKLRWAAMLAAGVNL